MTAAAGRCHAIICIVMLLSVNAFIAEAAEGLTLGFYDKTCPEAESLIRTVVEKHIPLAPSLAAPLLRMHFHDCFVRGCDGSVLLNSTSTNRAEKDAVPNLSLRGFHIIDEAKAEVEKYCPGVVSCADILTLVARDSVSVAYGGPYWRVPTGRRDGRISNQAEALRDIPSPFFNFSQLNASFASKGLDIKDLVLLSGAHTIGIAHCPVFSSRLYNFTGRGDVDPSLDKFYAAELKKNKCKTPTDNTTIVEMDPGSFRTFDTHYYVNLVKRRVLFTSDAALLTNSISKAFVLEQLQGSPVDSNNRFFSDFAVSVEKMGAIGVLTGTNGEIRRQCAFVNS